MVASKDRKLYEVGQRDDRLSSYQIKDLDPPICMGAEEVLRQEPTQDGPPSAETGGKEGGSKGW
jgi:hypothetical protein